MHSSLVIKVKLSRNNSVNLDVAMNYMNVFVIVDVAIDW